MEWEWAEKLVQGGKLRLGSLAFYRGLEHNELGDKWEGIGRRDLNGMVVEVTDASEVFVFCAALPVVGEGLLNLDKKYDAIVRVDDPVGFARAVAEAGREAGIDLFAQIGACRYNRGAGVEVPGKTVWGSSWNVFEKEPKFAHQCEYRFAFFKCEPASEATTEPHEDPDQGTDGFLYLTIKDPARYLSVAHRV